LFRDYLKNVYGEYKTPKRKYLDILTPQKGIEGYPKRE
jgi:hypothetical protein